MSLELKGKVHKFPWKAIVRMFVLVFCGATLIGCQSRIEGHGLSDSYFPGGSFEDLNEYYIEQPDRTAAVLSQLGEPVIYDDSSLVFSVRLTVRTSFHGSYVIAVQQTSDLKKMGHLSKLIANDSSAEAILQTKKLSVTDEHIRLIRRAIVDESFWSVNSYQELVGPDGDSWVLEVKDGDRFHVAYNWLPTAGAVFNIGSLLKRFYLDSPSE